MARAPRPQTESRAELAKRRAAHQTVFRFHVGDDSYTLAPYNTPVQEKLAVQSQTGLPWEEVVRPFTQEQISSASLAVLVWAARRASGEPRLKWAAFAESWDAEDLGFETIRIEVLTDEAGEDPEA